LGPPGGHWGLRAIAAAEYRAVTPGATSQITAPHWLLEMSMVGTLEVRVERSVWRPRTPGTGVLYAPSARYRERLPDPPPPGGYRSLFVSFAAEPGSLGELLPSGQPAVWIEDPGRMLQPLLREIVAAQDAGPAAALAATGFLYQAAALLVAAEARRDELLIRPYTSAVPDRIATLHRYMRENLARPIRIRDLADRVGLSESALSHEYRRITGRTPMSALRALRIEAATLHLVRGRLTLQGIAELTGFADAFHLSRTFKRATGRSPREFLRSAQKTP
jgi:AraC-like DNA-binding protein